MYLQEATKHSRFITMPRHGERTRRARDTQTRKHRNKLYFLDGSRAAYLSLADTFEFFLRSIKLSSHTRPPCMFHGYIPTTYLF